MRIHSNFLFSQIIDGINVLVSGLSVVIALHRFKHMTTCIVLLAWLLFENATRF